MPRSTSLGTTLLELILLVSFSVEGHSQNSPVISIEEVRTYFKEAESICMADGGRLWGISLCGPIMLVDPGSRSIVASHPDSEGILKEENGAFVGRLPVTQNIANTAVTWAGVNWTQIMWPLPSNARERHTLIAHELFHRIQGQHNIPPMQPMKGGDNSHLDTMEGRYYLQLEWRALTRALQATTEVARRTAAMDAILFRAVRYQLFPDAAVQEQALEINEGLAEYTGVIIGNPTAEEQIEAALRDLAVHTSDSTFVRSFAYATGPAYGLLLDRYVSGWRQLLPNGERLDSLLQKGLSFHLSANIEAAAKERARQYDGNTLRTLETEREAKRQQIIALYRARFVDGAVLIIPLQHMNVQFDPRNLQPLGDVGTVYPNMRITDDWGVLEVANGALLKSNWKSVVVTAPESENSLKGDGWTLELKPGWKIVSEGRRGDFTLSPGP